MVGGAGYHLYQIFFGIVTMRLIHEKKNDWASTQFDQSLHCALNG